MRAIANSTYASVTELDAMRARLFALESVLDGCTRVVTDTDPKVLSVFVRLPERAMCSMTILGDRDIRQQPPKTNTPQKLEKTLPLASWPVS